MTDPINPADVRTDLEGDTLRVHHVPTGAVIWLYWDGESSLAAAREEGIRRITEYIGPAGEPDATAISAEDLLRRWFHWSRDEPDVSLPTDLLVATAAFLTVQAVAQGRKVYGPHSL